MSMILLNCTIFVFTGCLHQHAVMRYRAISDQTFVLPCDLLPEDPVSIFNHSCHYDRRVQWFWQPNDGKTRNFPNYKTINPAYCGDVLWFNPIKVQNSGTYICVNRFVTGREIRSVVFFFNIPLIYLLFFI